MSSTSLSSGIYPFVRFTTFQALGGNVGVPLVGLGEHSPSNTIIEGIDVVDLDLTVNNTGFCSIIQPGLGSASAPFFQFVVYDTSQAWFSWRGELVVASNQRADITVFAGNWSYAVWGRVEPDFTLGA